MFITVHKLDNQPRKKEMMCNMIHKAVTKYVENHVVTIPFVLYFFLKTYTY